VTRAAAHPGAGAERTGPAVAPAVEPSSPLPGPGAVSPPHDPELPPGSGAGGEP
jgi:hypothetical protein